MRIADTDMMKFLYKYSSLVILLLFFSGCKSTEKQVDSEPRSVEAYSVSSEVDQTFFYAGEPENSSYPNPVDVYYNEGYVLGYDEERGIPAWVGYRVFKVDEYTTFSRPSRFLIDSRTDNRVSHDDYTNSGYDRGHMAPNFAIVTRFGQEAQRETFYMTNIIPQKPSLNRHWWQRLERLIARDYSEKYDEVWVIIGPVFKENSEWLNDKVKVPSHNFMIIKTEENGDVKMKAFLVHQDVESSEPHIPYLTTVREIEELTGFNFNPLLDENIADSLEILELNAMWQLTEN